MYDPTQPSPYDAKIRTLADSYDIPHDSFRKLLYTESNFNPKAVSPNGAKGIAQFIPDTGKAYGLLTDEDFFDADKSLEASAKYLSDLKNQYGGNWAAAVAHYNGGTSQGKLVASGAAPTKQETAEYVKKIGVFAEGDTPTPNLISTKDIIHENVKEVYEGAGIDYTPVSSVNDLPFNRDLFKRSSLLDTTLGNYSSSEEAANDIVNLIDSIKYNSTLGAWVNIAAMRLARYSVDGDMFGRNSKVYTVTKDDMDLLVKKYGSIEHPAAQLILRNTYYEGDFENLVNHMDETIEYNKQVANAGVGNTLVDMAAQAIWDPLNFIPMGFAFSSAKSGSALLGRLFNSPMAAKLGWYSAMAGIGGTFGAASEGLRQYTTGVEMNIREAFVGGALMVSALHGLGVLGGKSGKWLKDSAARAELIETGNKLGKDLGNLKGLSGNAHVGAVLNKLNKKTIARWEAIKKASPKLTIQDWGERSDSELVRKFTKMFHPSEVGRPTAGATVKQKGGTISQTRGDTGTLTTKTDDGNTLSVEKIDGDTIMKNDIPDDSMVNVHRDGDTIFDTRQRLIGAVNYYREQFAQNIKKAMSTMGISFHEANQLIHTAGLTNSISKLPEHLKNAAMVYKESMQMMEGYLKNPELISGKKNLPSLLSDRAGRLIGEDGMYIPVRSDGEKVENLIDSIGKHRELAIEELREDMAKNLWEGVISNKDRFSEFKDIIDTAWMEMAAKDPNYKTPIQVMEEKWDKLDKQWKDISKEITDLARQDADISRQLKEPIIDPANVTPGDVVVKDYIGEYYSTLSDEITPDHKVVVRESIKSYLKKMIDSGTLSDRQKGVADLLHRIIDPNMEISVYDRAFVSPNLGGFYWAVTNDIHLPNRAHNDPHIVLHEVLHAVTSRRIREVERGRGTTLQREANSELLDTFLEAEKQLQAQGVNTSTIYGFTNLHEFISEGLTNPAFYTQLKGLKSPKTGQTLFTRIMKGLQKLFGIGNQEATLLDDLFASTEKLMRGQTKQISSSSMKLNFGAKVTPAIKQVPDQVFDTSATIKGLDEVDGLTPEMVKQIKAERAAIRRKMKSRQAKLDKTQAELDKIGLREDIPNKVYGEELQERASKAAYGYINQRMDQRNFWDTNGGFDDMNPYEQRMPWDHFYKSQGTSFSVSDILDNKMMDLYDGYMNRVVGDLSVLNTTGSPDGFQFLKDRYNEAALSIQQRNKNTEREQRAMRMMIYQAYGLPVSGVSRSGARATKSFIEGMFDTAANMGLFTKNAAFGVMNYFEVAAGVRAYGASFFFKNLPGIGKFLKNLSSGKNTVEELRMLENMVFHKDIGETMFLPREYEKNLERYNNKLAAALVTGSKWLANNSPLTQFMYHSQNTIVSTARQELLAEMTRFVHKGDINPKGFFTDKHLKRLGIPKEDLEHVMDVLKKCTYMDDKGSPRISDDYIEHITPKFKHYVHIIGEYVANEVIQRETPGSLLLWKGGNNSSMMNYLMQFKSFAIKSINKRILKAGNRYAYEGDKDFVHEYFIDSALQTLQTIGITHLRANAISDPEKRKKYLQRQYGVDEMSWDNFTDPDFLYHAAIKGLYDRNSRLAGLSLVTGALGLTSDAAKTSVSEDRLLRQNDDGVSKPVRLMDKAAGYVPSVGYLQDVVNLGTSAYNLSGSAVGLKNLTPKEKEQQAEYMWNSIKNTLMPNDPLFMAHIINFAKEQHKAALK